MQVPWKSFVVLLNASVKLATVLEYRFSLGFLLLKEAGAQGGGKWRNSCYVWIQDNQT